MHKLGKYLAVVHGCNAKQCRGECAPSTALVKLAGASVQELDLWVMTKRLLLQGVPALGLLAGAGAIVKELDLWVLMRKRLRLIGSTMRSRSAAFKAALVAKFAEEFRTELRRGELRPVVEKVLTSR